MCKVFFIGTGRRGKVIYQMHIDWNFNIIDTADNISTLTSIVCVIFWICFDKISSKKETSEERADMAGRGIATLARDL